MKKLIAFVVVALFAVTALAVTQPPNVTGSEIADVIADVVHGTAGASKALILDANKDVTGQRHITATGTVQSASVIATTGTTTAALTIGDTVLGATAAELNNIADVSANAQAILVAGAITADGSVRNVTLSGASGAYAVTLAAPTVAGSVLTITYLTGSTNAITLALTNVIGGTAGTTASFDAVNETLVLVSTGVKWVVIAQTGVTLS